MATLHRCRTPIASTHDLLKVFGGVTMGIAVVTALLVGITLGAFADATARLRGRSAVRAAQIVPQRIAAPEVSARTGA